MFKALKIIHHRDAGCTEIYIVNRAADTINVKNVFLCALCVSVVKFFDYNFSKRIKQAVSHTSDLVGLLLHRDD